MKIKWVKNSRVRKNSTIDNDDILEKESDAHGDDIIVIMKNVTKENPIVNIKLPRKPKTHSYQSNNNGKLVNRSWTDYSKVIVNVDTESGDVNFSHKEMKLSELNNVVQILNKIKPCLK